MMIGASGGSDPWLLRILNRIFRCSHRRQGRPITPRGGGQSYAVCLDCGTRLAYDLNAMRAEASVPGTGFQHQTSKVAKEKILDIPEYEFMPGVRGPWERMSHDSPRFHRQFGTTAVLWIGAMSLAGALLYLPNRQARPRNATTPQHARSLPTGSVKSSDSLPEQESGIEVLPAPQQTRLANPTVSTEPLSTMGEKVIEPDSTSASPATGSSNEVLRLDGKGPVIVLGRGAVVAMELSKHPEGLSKLIRRGSLFTVRRGTAIKLLQTKRLGNGSVIRVLITEGPRAGQEGWAQPWQARPLPSNGPVNSSPSLPVQEPGKGVAPDPQTTKLVAKATVSTELTSPKGEKTIEPDSTFASATTRSNQVLRLEDKGAVVVLGREAVAALELSQHPERLSNLIRRGSLFTVPRGTAIKLLQGNRSGNRFVIRVRIMDGSSVGQEGWAQTWQVSP